MAELHPHPAFVWTDQAAMRGFVQERGFAHLFAAGRLAHAPLLVAEDGRLRFHLARANPLAGVPDGTTMVASIGDADGYVSPDWYGTPDQVPTWNYVAVEVEGRLRRLDGGAVAELLDGLSAAHEARLAPKPAWTRAKMTSGRFEAMLAGVIGFEIAEPRWRGTRKLGQNKPAGQRARLADALAAVGRGREAALVREGLR